MHAGSKKSFSTEGNQPAFDRAAAQFAGFYVVLKILVPALPRNEQEADINPRFLLEETLYNSTDFRIGIVRRQLKRKMDVPDFLDIDWLPLFHGVPFCALRIMRVGKFSLFLHLCHDFSCFLAKIRVETIGHDPLLFLVRNFLAVYL